eukprot:c7076_g1_i2.p1 GENE.c7076_g1_i2~~c7076_g1_i2.p1  ORF type:complete len:306 (-),score=60.32 c7076_g1_i2:46-963(-)
MPAETHIITTTHRDGDVQLFDLNFNTNLWNSASWTVTESGICSICFLSDGLVAIGADSGDVQLLVQSTLSSSVSQDSDGQVLVGHSGAVSGVRMCGDGIVVTSGADGHTRRWNVKASTCEAIAKAPCPIDAIDCNEDGQLVYAVSAHYNGGLFVWDTRTTTPTTSSPFLPPPPLSVGSLSRIACGPNLTLSLRSSNEICVGGEDGVVKLFDLRSMSSPIATFAFSDAVTAMTCFENTLTVGTAQGDIFTGTLTSDGTWLQEKVSRVHESKVTGICAYNNNNAMSLVTCSWDHTVKAITVTPTVVA